MKNLNGIDISSYNDIEDWNALKQQGVQIVIQKATEGITYVDKYLDYRYSRIKTAGIKFGVYHFASGNNSAEAEAKHFLNTIAKYTLDTVAFLDIENHTDKTWQRQEAIDFANAWFNYVKGKGYKVGLYTGEYFYQSLLQGYIPNDVVLWIANYSKRPDGNVSWQYSEKGQLAGANGYLDLDEFRDDIYISTTIKEVKKVKDLVCYSNDVDRRAAEYLGDALLCPTIQSDLPFDYSTVENVYCVGGPGKLPFTAMAKKIIAGTDRYDTCQQVLNFIKNGCK